METSNLYFEAYAVSLTGSKRYFENLDSILEVQEWAEKMIKLNYNKIIVKSFDSNGFRKCNTYILNPSNDTWDLIKKS